MPVGRKPDTDTRLTSVSHPDRANYEKSTVTKAVRKYDPDAPPKEIKPVRGRGRPPGVKNRPKGLIPAEVAENLLSMMKDKLPGEHYKYMQSVMKGESISTEKEIDMLITMVRGTLMPYLAVEAIPSQAVDAEGNPLFDENGEPVVRFPGVDRDTTDRLKSLVSLLSLKDSLEKRKQDGSESREHTILKIVAGRGFDSSRIGVLVGGLPGNVVGDSDSIGRPALPARTVSNSFPERSESDEGSEQGEATWVLDDPSGGSAGEGSD